MNMVFKLKSKLYPTGARIVTTSFPTTTEEVERMVNESFKKEGSSVVQDWKVVESLTDWT